jgi:hypothetical protein
LGERSRQAPARVPEVAAESDEGDVSHASSQQSEEEETVVPAEGGTQHLCLYDTGFPISRE